MPALSIALRARALPIALVPVTIAAGLGARAILGGLPAKLAGDALYTALLHVLVLVARPDTRPRTAAAIALGASVAIELAQLTPYPAWLSSKHLILRLIFGTTFGFEDLLGYALGAALSLALHALFQGRRAPRRS
jgi:hypothetical protein